MFGTVIAALVALFIFFFLFMGIIIVPNQTAIIVERLGKYHSTLLAGFHLIIPFVDRRAYRRTLKENVLDVPAQTCITSDNVSVSIDGVIYMQVVDPMRSAYGISDYVTGAVQLAQTSLRSAIGRMPLDKTFESREQINQEVCSDLNAATTTWGVKVLRYEIRDLTPPASIMQAMERQVKAEREKRAVILKADGEKQAAITAAEGEKEAAILRADAVKQQRILEAEGEAQAILAVQQANADAIRLLNEAMPSDKVLALRSLEALAKVADGRATKLIIPSNLQDLAGTVASIKELVTDPEPEAK